MKVLITRPREQSQVFAKSLISAGFVPVFCPVIKIRPFKENEALDRAMAILDQYEWVIFTSVNGVEAFIEHLPHPKSIQGPGRRFKVAAIGPKTATTLTLHGITPDFVPGEFVAEAILPGLGDLRGQWVLLPCAEIARDALPRAICEAGGIPHEIAVYQTLPAQLDPEGLAALERGVDVVTFTSPSTVEFFVDLVRQAGLDPLHLPGEPGVVCIGPVTRKAAEEAGFAKVWMANEYTTEGMVDLLGTMEKKR